jgi:hypothetical protein
MARLQSVAVVLDARRNRFYGGGPLFLLFSFFKIFPAKGEGSAIDKVGGGPLPRSEKWGTEGSTWNSTGMWLPTYVLGMFLAVAVKDLPDAVRCCRSGPKSRRRAAEKGQERVIMS